MGRAAARTFKLLATGERIHGEVTRRKRGELTIRTPAGIERYLRESAVEEVTATIEQPASLGVTTTGRDGRQYTFEVDLDHDARAHTWTYRVRAAGSVDFYQATFTEVPGAVQPTALLASNDASYRGKGIADMLFARVVADTGRQLVSSTNAGQKNFGDEWRSADADRIWRRLFGEERASYDATQDRYTFVPQGTARGPFGRPQPNRRPQFYVKGSYVLDRIFGTNYANDIDVFWLGTGGRPSEAHIAGWMSVCALPPKPIQLAQVTDFFACDGGGAPIFNMDLWRIEMDGCVYQMDPASHVAAKIPVAPQTSLSFLRDLPPFAVTPSAETNAVLGKALAKMARHRSLFDAAIQTEINLLMARPVPPI